MSCVLRAIGAEFDVDRFLQDSQFAGATSFRRGEPRVSVSAEAKVNQASGFTLPVSEAGLADPEAQVGDAIAFLRVQEEELRRLSQFPGLEEMCLDFAIQRRDVAAQVDVFPAELLWQAGALDIDLVVTHYAVSED